MPINTNVTKDQITVAVGETQIDVNVSGGIGPTGPQGAPGATDYNQLTNVPSSFNPAAHASRHTAGSSDPVTIVAAQVSDFASAVVAAAPPTTNASLLVSGTLADARLSGNVVLTTDPRLTDSREWSASTVSQADAEAGTSTSRFAFTPQRVFQAIAAWWAGSAAKTKLDGIASGATANATDAQLRDRSTHTGTQTASTISDFTTAVVAAAPPTTNASLLTSGTLPDARLSSNIARTSDVSSAVAAVVDAAPASLDTLKELAAALGNDASFSATVTNTLAAKAPINNPTFTGTVSGVTKSMVGLGNVPNVDATARANHTGTQAIGTVDGLQSALDGKAASSHSHGNITSDGKIGTVAGKAVVTGEAGVLQTSDYAENAEYLWDSVNGYKTFAFVDTTPVWTDAAIQNDVPTQFRDSIGAAATSHSHGSITTDGKLGTTSGLPLITTTGGVITVGAFGTSAGQFCQGNDSRLSNSRAPTAHKSSHATGGSDALTPSDIGAAAVSHAHSATNDLTFSGATAGQVLTVNSGATALVWSTPATYSLPTASASTLGGVKIGSGLSIDGSGVLTATYSYTLPAATTSTLGGVIVGSGLSVTSGTVSANVTSVAGRTGAVTIAAGDVSGLGTLAIQSGTFSGTSSGTNTGDQTITLTGDVTGTGAGTFAATIANGAITDAKITSGGLSASAINWAAIQDWAPSTAYAKGDLVNYLGVVYRRSAAGTSGTTFTSSNWQQVTPSTGSTGSTLCVGNDARLSDQRTPTDGSVTTAKLANAAVTVAKISASGTPSASTYLDGSGAWSAPTASVTYATQTQAQDGASTTVAMNPARTLDEMYNVYQIDLSQANQNTTGQTIWQTAFAGFVQVQVGSASVSGGGGILAYHGLLASPTLAKWNGSAGNFAGRYVNWARRQRFRLRVMPNAAISTNTTYRFLYGKTTVGTANIGALAQRGIGFEIRSGGALWLTTHNGTSRTDTTAGTSLATQALYEIVVESDGSGNATLFLDGTAVATNTGAPTASPSDLSQQYFVVEATTTDQSVNLVIIDRHPQILRP